MPSSVVKSFAQKSGKSVAEVEKIWNDSKTEASGHKVFKGYNPNFWAYVTAIVKKKLGIKESLKFSEFSQILDEEKDSLNKL